ALEVKKPKGKPLAPVGPFQTPPTTAVLAVAFVLGAVPDFAEVETVKVVEVTVVTRPMNTAGALAPSMYTLANIPTVTPSVVGFPLAGVNTPVPEFHPPLV